MSYVRWSSPGHPWNYDSDLYIYDYVNGGTICAWCSLMPHADNWRGDVAETPTGESEWYGVPGHPETIAHVREHIAAGHAVPEFVIPRLEIDQGFN